MTEPASPPPISAPQILKRADGETIAYSARESQSASGLGALWLGGFHSDMEGSKALALDDWAASAGHGYVRFDYFGHGQSSGDFADGTISRWLDDSLAVLDEVTKGPQILVGSSMGGWLAALVALARPKRVAGIVFIAPAPDFTEDLMWAEFNEEIKKEIEKTGRWMRPSDYGFDPYPITKDLIEDGRDHLILRAPIPITCPVRIFHGMADPDVPWQRSLKLVEELYSADVVTHFVKNGDHRLSDEANLSRLLGIVGDLACQLES